MQGTPTAMYDDSVTAARKAITALKQTLQERGSSVPPSVEELRELLVDQLLLMHTRSSL